MPKIIIHAGYPEPSDDGTVGAFNSIDGSGIYIPAPLKCRPPNMSSHGLRFRLDTSRSFALVSGN